MKRFHIVSLLLIICLMAGCSGVNAQELYCLPEAPEDYYDLQETLSAVMDQGYSYYAPTSGTHRETVQLVDLSGDGVDEAVAFFRSDIDGAVKAYIFSKQNDIYETDAVIDCAGSSVASVEYIDLDGGGSLELLLACQVSETVAQALQVCRYAEGEAVTLETIPCSRYALADLGGNGSQMLFCFEDNGSDPCTVGAYCFREGQFLLEKELNLSVSYGDILRLQEICLEDDSNGLAVASVLGENQTVYDIFTLSEDAVIRVRSAETLVCDNLRGGTLYPQDVDGDGRTEFPKVEALPAYGEGATAQSVVLWYGVDSQGESLQKAMTYHDFGSKWYLELPETWQDQIVIKQNDVATSISTVSSAIFYRLDEQGRPGEDILTIYTLKGTDQQSYAEDLGLSILYSSTEVVYAVSINDGAESWEGSISMAQVSDGFHPMEQ